MKQKKHYQYTLECDVPDSISPSEIINVLADEVRTEVHSHIHRDGVVRELTACWRIIHLQKAISILMEYADPKKLDANMAPFRSVGTTSTSSQNGAAGEDHSHGTFAGKKNSGMQRHVAAARAGQKGSRS